MKKILLIGMLILLVGCNSDNKYTEQHLHRFYEQGFEDGYWDYKREDTSWRLSALEREVFNEDIVNFTLFTSNFITSTNISITYDNAFFEVYGTNNTFTFLNSSCSYLNSISL